jgi:DNA-binding SARP family transcriptional activator
VVVVAVEYRLLGPVEVVAADGRVLPVHGAKLQGLVALLALDAGRVVSSARLVEALYGEPYPRVENALQQLVSKLRRVLAAGGAAERLHTRAPGYALDEPGEAVDALRFEMLIAAARGADPAVAARTLREAVALWRGAPADGATLEGESAALRTRLTELCEAAVEDRIECELQLGMHTALVGELEAMVAATPLRERRWGQLMTALYRCGRQGDALRVYRAARRTLAEELGIEPGPALRGLEAAVLAHDEALLPPPAAPSATAPGPSDGPVRQPSPTPAPDGAGLHPSPAAAPGPIRQAAAMPPPREQERPTSSGPPSSSEEADAQPAPAGPSPSQLEGVPAAPPRPQEPPQRVVRAGRIRHSRTRCLGRDTELAELAALVERPGLTTLVGPGGVGKTRLAIEVAELLDHRLPDGARWVELTPVTAHGVG